MREETKRRIEAATARSEQEIVTLAAKEIIEQVSNLGTRKGDFDLGSMLYRVREKLNQTLKKQEDKWAREL